MFVNFVGTMAIVLQMAGVVGLAVQIVGEERLGEFLGKSLKIVYWLVAGLILLVAVVAAATLPSTGIMRLLAERTSTDSVGPATSTPAAIVPKLVPDSAAESEADGIQLLCEPKQEGIYECVELTEKPLIDVDKVVALLFAEDDDESILSVVGIVGGLIIFVLMGLLIATAFGSSWDELSSLLDKPQTLISYLLPICAVFVLLGLLLDIVLVWQN